MATNTLATNIGRTVSDFADIRDAIIEKNVAVPGGTPTAEYGNLIRQIQTECELKSGQLNILDNVRIGSLGQWETLKGSTDPRRFRASTVSAGEDIYLVAGYSVDTFAVYNTKSRIYKGLSRYPAYRGGTGCVHKDGKLYCFGGSSGDGGYVYDIETNIWRYLTTMPTIREFFACIETDGDIYCIGGNGWSDKTDVNEVYSIATNSWSTRTAMPESGHIGTYVLIGRNIHIIGLDSSPQNQHYVYNIDTDSWSTLAALPRPRPYSHGCYHKGKIYVIGGDDAEMTDKGSELMDIYDVATNTWSTGPSLPKAIVPQVSLINDTIYVFSNRLTTLFSYEFDPFLFVKPHSVIKVDKDALLDNETIPANVKVTTGNSISKLRVEEGTSGTIYQPLDDIIITAI